MKPLAQQITLAASLHCALLVAGIFSTGCIDSAVVGEHDLPTAGSGEANPTPSAPNPAFAVEDPGTATVVSACNPRDPSCQPCISNADCPVATPICERTVCRTCASNDECGRDGYCDDDGYCEAENEIESGDDGEEEGST